MSLEPITRHFGDGLVKLAPPFWGKPIIASLLRSRLNRVQEFENECWAVINAFHINTCDATRLAILGKVVGQPNIGWDTETYRGVVRAKIATNRSRGTEDDLATVVHLALGTDDPITIRHQEHAAVVVVLGEPITEGALTALDFLLPRARPVGVQLHLVRPFANGLRSASATTPGLGSGVAASSVSGGTDVAASVHRL